MDALAEFAAEAALFQQWARYGTDHGESAAREALLRVSRLYLAALRLPSASTDAGTDTRDPERVGDEEWRAVYDACSRLPLQFYGIALDPLQVDDEAGIGDLADDISDIYREVVGGLRAYNAGQPADAVWQWHFGFWSHWGEHATGAIRALHSWLAANQLR